MPSVARGTLLTLALAAGLLLVSGCAGTGEPGSAPPSPVTPGTMPATVPPATVSPAAPAATTPDLSLPPPVASPYPAPSADPIVGTWYAPVPDDLTFEFFSDGTFTERSPAFRTYHGTWEISEEGEAGFYDATILDRWGFRREVHILHTSGTLFIKSMGTLHRVG